MNDQEFRIQAMQLALKFEGHLASEDALMKLAQRIYDFLVPPETAEDAEEPPF